MNYHFRKLKSIFGRSLLSTFDHQLNDRGHTDRRCVYRDSDMHCIYDHHDTNVSVNNDNIYYNVYSFDMLHREHSVLVHYNFYNVLLVT